MQYKIQIESNFKDFKSDLNAASKIVDKITGKLKYQHRLKVQVEDTVSKHLKNPLQDAEKTVRKLNSTKVRIPVSVTGNAAVKALTTSFKTLGKGVKATTQYLKEMTMQLRITEGGMNFLIRSNNAIGSTMAYISVSAADEFIKVEHALNRVRAVAGETKEQYHLLKEATLGVAESSSLTAKQIASGSEILALAGFKTNEIIEIQERLVTSVINSGESIVTNTENITSSLRVWNTHLSILDDTVDKLTSGMANAKTTVGELGRGAAAASNIFKQTGQGTSALVSALQAMADQSIKGATAGKGLSTVMQRFAAPTARAAALLDEYGISLVKSGSNAKQQQIILDSLGKTIDGTNDAINVLSAAYNRGETSIKPYLAQLESLGIKTRTATGNYKSFDHVVEQLIQKNNKAYAAQVQVNEQFGNANRITNSLANELRRLGIDVGLSGGSMKGIIPVAEELAVKFKDISQAERLAFASDLAGKHQAPKLLALVNAAEKAKYSIDILGQSFDVYTSKLSLNQAKNDLATISGRKFATVFRDLGGSVSDLIPAVRDFNVQLDHHSQQIVGANGSVEMFIQSVLRFKTAGDSWSDAILKATNASKLMTQNTDNLNTVLGRLGSSTEFSDLNGALDELKRHIDRSSDTQVLHAFNDVMTEDMARAFVTAANNGTKFSTEMINQLGSIVGKSKEMRTEIESTTKHILDRMVSTWQSTLFKIGEAMQPLLNKLLEIGIIGSQVLGEVLPPLVSGMVSWLDKFDFSADTVRATMLKFFDVVAKVGKGIYEVFVTIMDASGASSITFDGIIQGIADTLRIFLTVIQGVGKGLSWLGLISDAQASEMEMSFNRLDNTFTNVTDNINNNIDSTVRQTGYWQQETTTATTQIRNDFDITKNNIFSFGDDVSQSMHTTATDVTTASQTMAQGVTDNVTQMTTQSSQQVEQLAQNVGTNSEYMSQSAQRAAESMRVGTTASVTQMATDVPILTEQMKTETDYKVQEMSQLVVDQTTNMQTQATTETDAMRENVGTKVEQMKEETIVTTSSFVSDMGAMFTGLKDQVVADASSMYEQVTSIASSAMEVASNVRSSVSSAISSATSSISDFMSGSSISEFMSGSSISDYMSQPSSITQSMQDTTINTNSTGLLQSINAGTYFVPPEVTNYDNMRAWEEGADPRYMPSAHPTIGLSPPAGNDYEPWWQEYAQTNPNKYQEYVEAGLHSGAYLPQQQTAQLSQITQIRNADGSITYTNTNNNETARDQLNETRKTNEILENLFDANNFYISVT